MFQHWSGAPDLPWEFSHSSTRLGAGLGLLVAPEDLGRHRRRHRPRHDEVNKRVTVEDEPLQWRARHHQAECRQRSLRRPIPGVREDHPRHPARALQGDCHSYWPTPVLTYDDPTVEVAVVDQLAYYLRMLGRGVAVPRRPLRQSEAWIVHRDAAKLAFELGDYLPVQETPRRIAMEHHHWATLALIDVM